MRKRQVPWDVFLHGKWVDTVYFDYDCGEQYILDRLIDHDGLDSDISVRAKR